MANTLRFKRGLVATIPTAAAGEPLFTTDTFDLYIGNGTTNTRFQKYIASGATTQILRGDGSLYTFPLSISSPTNGQVLKYNGTSWVNDSDSGITGSGVAGQVAYFTGATTQTGSNNLFWDASNNRLGIGTNVPAVAIDVAGASNLSSRARFEKTGTTKVLQFGADRDTSALPYIGSESNHGFSIITNNTERARIDASGNLGLGVTPSAWAADKKAIQLGGASYYGSTLYYSHNFSLANAYFDGVNFKYISNTSASHYRQVDGVHSWYTAPIGSAGANITFTQPMTLTANGRLLLGTTIEGTQRLQVAGDAYINGGLAVSSTSYAFEGISLRRNLTGLSIAYGVVSAGTIQSDVTSQVYYYESGAKTQAASFTLPALYHYSANQGTFGAGSAVTNQYGFFVQSTLTGATNNYGFYGNIASGTGRWNLYMNGTAANYMAGDLVIGITTTGAEKLRVVNNSNANATAMIRNQAADGYSTLNFYDNGNTVRGAIGYSNASASTHPDALLVWAFTGKDVRIISGLTNVSAFRSNGNLVVGFTGTDSGEKLQVTGTMKVTGASTFGGAMTLAINQNAGTIFTAQNTTAGTSSYSQLVVRSDASAGAGGIIKHSSSYTTYKINTPSSTCIYNGTAGDIVLLNDVGAGTIKMAAGGSSTAHFTIASTGAATFSSSVTAASYNATTQNIFSVGGTEGMRLTSSNRNLHIGTFVSDSGEKLQVTGTMKVTGASTFDSAVNAQRFIPTGSTVPSNGMYLPTTNTIAFSTNTTERIRVTSTGSVGVNTNSPSGKFEVSSADFDTIYLSRTSVGAASTIMRDVNDSGGVVQNIAGGGLRFLTRTNGTNSSSVLDIASTGAATFSSSIQAATAIAIGTTPDTNKPFKILKSINGTVGINFENTSTGSLAFSAIQMGTDVTGGTKFTNLVYASSGVTASGVYNPDGTSLINNGSGGLNFLGNPIRMYTGGSNGTLRWDMTNDGFITQYNGTNPSTNATDGYRQYSADVTAGNAAPHFRTENGAVIKLYQETTSVGNSIISLGGGNAVLDDTTFDGYTLRQLVRALRNQGILQ